MGDVCRVCQSGKGHFHLALLPPLREALIAHLDAFQPYLLVKARQTEFAAGPSVMSGGADRDRTDDLLSAIQALSQLSYSPTPTTKYSGERTALPSRTSRDFRARPRACGT